MITYTVKYKKINSLFYKTIKKCKGDGFLTEAKSRFFITENEERYEIPWQETIFKFSKERWMSISQRMSQEAGQEIKINKR